jgi:putative ABC transport system permease protein
VELAAHQTWFGGFYQDQKNFFMQCPVEPEEFLEVVPEILLPEDQREAWLKTRTGAIVGRTTADRFGFEIGSKVPITTPIWYQKDGNNVWEFDIVGIYDGEEKGTDTSPMYFRYDYFDEARAGMEGYVGWYSIKVNDPDRAGEIAEMVDQEFANSSAETKTEPEGAFVQGWANQIGNIALIVAAILSAVFFTILLVTGNTISQSVRERTGELGVLKAIGFTNGQIMFFVLAESCLLSLVGGVVGLGLAWMMISGGDPTGGMLPMFAFRTPDLLIGFGICLAMGLATGILPAWQAMRLAVADALRRM